MTPQSQFMIVATIRTDQLQALQDLLASMNTAPGFADGRNSVLPYWQFERLHVARFTILEASQWPPTLCFIGDIDGDSETFLAELVIRAEPGLRKIFEHCEGFSARHSILLQWILQHSVSPAANYVNWHGRTVLQVREEQALREALAVEVRRDRYAGMGAIATWLELRHFVKREQQDSNLRLTPEAPTPTPWFICNLLHLLLLPLILLCLSPVLLLLSPIYFYKLRKLEESDSENTLRAPTEHLQRLAEQEDIDVSNHFNVFGQVKPGILRLITIRAGLILLNYASRHIYRRGYLTRIQTIHFARWVMLDNNRRVFFASNYDGSAESYMDDFINKVAWGLNLVFSNGVGYPRTRWLIKGGALNEENYKRTLRYYQLPSESWYKAYPGLTAVDLARNSRVRRLLERDNASEDEIHELLSLL